MLAVNGLLKFLSEEDQERNYQSDNDDLDLGMVLEFCGNETLPKHEILYSDGQKKTFSFDE